MAQRRAVEGQEITVGQQGGGAVGTGRLEQMGGCRGSAGAISCDLLATAQARS